MIVVELVLGTTWVLLPDAIGIAPNEMEKVEMSVVIFKYSFKYSVMGCASGSQRG